MTKFSQDVEIDGVFYYVEGEFEVLIDNQSFSHEFGVEEIHIPYAKINGITTVEKYDEETNTTKAIDVAPALLEKIFDAIEPTLID